MFAWKKNILKQLPQRGKIIVENKANKEKAPELPILISVTAVSSGASSPLLIQGVAAVLIKNQ